MIVIEAGMYDLKFKAPIDDKNFYNDKDNYLFF